MNRRLILDTETTGLDFDKDRIIEIACLELIDDVFSGEKFHNYYNPENIIINKQSEEIHGLSNDFLAKYKSFESEIQNFLEFIGNSQLIIHNAQFDLGMINNALKRIGKKRIPKEQTLCTLELSKKKFPGSKNNLNALCRRFNISLESREKHGALTDCFLLQEVYIELLGGKQDRLNLSQSQSSVAERFTIPKNFEPVLVKLSNEEERFHEELLKKINKPIWN